MRKVWRILRALPAITDRIITLQTLRGKLADPTWDKTLTETERVHLRKLLKQLARVLRLED